MKLTALEAFKKAKDLLSNKHYWTQGASAKDSTGVRVRVNDRSACQFCVSGAITRVIYSHVLDQSFHAELRPLLAKVTEQMHQSCKDLFGHESFLYVNDTLGYDAVMKMLDDCIKKETENELSEGNASGS